MNAEFDLVVVGAGTHGAGIAQSSAAQSYHVMVLEQQQSIAAGTSCRSSKLIHGGLRYLEQFDLRLVRECLRETKLLLTLAPKLVKLTPFYIPVYGNTHRPPWEATVSGLARLIGARNREPTKSASYTPTKNTPLQFRYVSWLAEMGEAIEIYKKWKSGWIDILRLCLTASFSYGISGF